MKYEKKKLLFSLFFFFLTSSFILVGLSMLKNGKFFKEDGQECPSS